MLKSVLGCGERRINSTNKFLVCCFTITVKAGYFQLRTAGRIDFLLLNEFEKIFQRYNVSSEQIIAEQMKLIYK